MTRSRATRWAAVLLGLLGNQAWTFAATAPTAPEVPAVGFSVLRVFGALLLVLAVFFAGVWLFKNWQRVATPHGTPPKLAVLEVKSLGNRHALYVVGYEKQRLLLASSPTGVALVSALPEAASEAAAVPATPGFAEALQQVLSRKP